MSLELENAKLRVQNLMLQGQLLSVQFERAQSELAKLQDAQKPPSRPDGEAVSTHMFGDAGVS